MREEQDCHLHTRIPLSQPVCANSSLEPKDKSGSYECGSSVFGGPSVGTGKVILSWALGM